MMEACQVVLFFFLVLSCIFQYNVVVFINTATDQTHANALGGMYTGLNSPQQLTGWIPNGGDPCGEGNWKGVTCTGSSVTSLILSGLHLNGNIGYNLQDLGSLKELDLSKNNLGNSIPYNNSKQQ